MARDLSGAVDDASLDRLGGLLERALALPPDQRRAFLDRECGTDTGLRDELLSLISASGPSASFFDEVTEQIVQPALRAAADEHRESPRPDPPGARALRPGDIVAHYEVLERIGGGMGVVFKARDVQLDRPVALKLLPPALATDESARRRLYAEARAASALDHPYIAMVHEIGDADPGGLFIALAWYDGETLKARLGRGPLPAPEAITLASQVADALAAAHRAGIIHRDIKPSNIMCTAQNTAKLLDFGIAKVAGAEWTLDGWTPGTIAYMSPEQTRGEPVDARSDLWSLGVVLYEMLAGQRPFRGDDDATLIQAIRHHEPDPLSSSAPDTPPALAAIVTTCLRKDPSLRYARAEALFAALEALDRGASRAARRAPKRR